jgi:hypothetical protein
LGAIPPKSLDVTPLYQGQAGEGSKPGKSRSSACTQGDGEENSPQEDWKILTLRAPGTGGSLRKTKIKSKCAIWKEEEVFREYCSASKQIKGLVEMKGNTGFCQIKAK